MTIDHDGCEKRQYRERKSGRPTDDVEDTILPLASLEDKREHLKRRFIYGAGLFIVCFLACTSAICLFPLGRAMTDARDFYRDEPIAHHTGPGIRATVTYSQPSETTSRTTYSDDDEPWEGATEWDATSSRTVGSPRRGRAISLTKISDRSSFKAVRTVPKKKKKKKKLTKKEINTGNIRERINDFLKDRIPPSSPVRIAHVTNFFSCATCSEFFRPLDQSQNITVASMQRAIKESKKSVPTVYAAVFEEDEYIVPEDFVTLSKKLTRSTSSEYPDLEPRKQLPFLDDILSSLYDSDNTNEFDYVIYTNSDIAVQKDFYDKVAALISMGYDAFAMNRRTIPKGNRRKPFHGNQLDALYSVKGASHPGTDCFIFKKEYYRNKFTLGEIFLGYPPIGLTFSQLLENSSKNWRKFTTYETLGTFHLGNDRDWKEEDALELTDQNERNRMVLMATFEEEAMI